MNEAYWQHPDGPVFLFIGGEGPIFEFDVLAGTVGGSTCPHLSDTHFKTADWSMQKMPESAMKLANTLLKVWKQK